VPLARRGAPRPRARDRRGRGAAAAPRAAGPAGRAGRDEPDRDLAAARVARRGGRRRLRRAVLDLVRGAPPGGHARPGLMRAAVLALAVLGATVASPASAASRCPTSTFLSFDHLAYASKHVPAGVRLPPGLRLA